MPVTDPRVKLGDDDTDGLTADVRTSDPAADTPAIVVRVAGTLGTAPPAGAATAAKQDAQTALLTTIDSDTGGIATSTASLDVKAPALVAGRIPVDASGVAVPVTDNAGSLTVDAGALDVAVSTRASESTLAALNAKVTAVDTGAVAVTSSALPSGAAQEHTAANSPHASRLTDGSAFYKAAVAGDNMGADIRVASAAATNANPVPVQLITTGSMLLGTEDHPLIASPAGYGLTTFGQLRVAQRFSLFENVQNYGLDPLSWGTQTATGGTITYSTTTGVTSLTVTGTSGSAARKRTHTYFIYQAGANQRVIVTVVHSDAGQANQIRRWGYFDANNGLFFELSGTTLNVVRRTSTSGAPVDTAVAQSAWNGDKLNGTGMSGVTLDITKGSRYEIDLQWLSFGTVRFWINGTLVHTFDFANVLALPYMRTAQLPLQLEIVNTGASTGATLGYVCSTVYRDGGTDSQHYDASWPLSAPKAGVGTTFTPVVGFRVAATFGGLTNRKLVVPTLVIMSNTGGRGTFRFIANPATTTGGAWAAVNALSGVEYNEGVTSFTGGIVAATQYLPNTSDAREFSTTDLFALNGSLLRRDAFDTASDSFLLLAKADAGTFSVEVTAFWKEYG